jgi:hypothetical protein
MTGTRLVRLLHYCKTRILTNCQISHITSSNISNLPIVSPPLSVCSQKGEVISERQYAVPVIDDILPEGISACN